MSEVAHIISNSTICSSCTILTICDELEELMACGILAAGEAALGTPYEMRRAAGCEALHTSVWFILEGEVVFEIPGKTVTAGPGMMLIHSSATNRRCIVSRGIFRHLFFHLPHRDHDTAAIASSYCHELQQLLRMLERESLAPPTEPTRKKQLSSLISSYLERELACSPQPSRILKIIELLEQNMDVCWTTATLAAQLNISPSLLYQLCARYFGKSPRNIIHKIKFRYATALLHQSGLPLEAIAAMTGYSSAFAFSKAFYKYTGKRPGRERYVNAAVNEH